MNKVSYPMKQDCGIGMKWLKALMLSPGVLFTAMYLAIWVCTNVYLDHAFRAQLTHAFTSATGCRYRLTIGSLVTGPELGSLTLNRLELIPTGSGGPTGLQNVHIEKLDISCPDIGLLLIRPSSAESMTRRVSKLLVCKCHGETLSMNQQSGPPPANRGDLASRIGQH